MPRYLNVHEFSFCSQRMSYSHQNPLVSPPMLDQYPKIAIFPNPLPPLPMTSLKIVLRLCLSYSNIELKARGCSRWKNLVLPWNNLYNLRGEYDIVQKKTLQLWFKVIQNHASIQLQDQSGPIEYKEFFTLYLGMFFRLFFEFNWWMDSYRTDVQVNTIRCEFLSQGMNHNEGGWPKV